MAAVRHFECSKIAVLPFRRYDDLIFHDNTKFHADRTIHFGGLAEMCFQIWRLCAILSLKIVSSGHILLVTVPLCFTVYQISSKSDHF